MKRRSLFNGLRCWLLRVIAGDSITTIINAKLEVHPLYESDPQITFSGEFGDNVVMLANVEFHEGHLIKLFPKSNTNKNPALRRYFNRL